ncbi:MAG TPA: AAA family ATPase [Spongiibacteraceae bacterium]|jgi:predicted ABC-type ATPase
MNGNTPARPFVLVLAGVNGAGKSSIGGALIAESGLIWFNPDTYASELIATLGANPAEANAIAWEYGRARLEAALNAGENFAFETTLGGSTIAKMLAAAGTHDVIMLYCGLASAELHIQRVQFRVAHGGHDIPEKKIRERWNSSRKNLIALLPRLAHLQVFDNSADVAASEEIPEPLLVMEMSAGKLLYPDPDDAAALAAVPAWARPIVQAAIQLPHAYRF